MISILQMRQPEKFLRSQTHKAILKVRASRGHEARTVDMCPGQGTGQGQDAQDKKPLRRSPRSWTSTASTRRSFSDMRGRARGCGPGRLYILVYMFVFLDAFFCYFVDIGAAYSDLAHFRLLHFQSQPALLSSASSCTI